MTANKERLKRRPIYDLEVFRTGDYSNLGRFEFGEKEIDQIRTDFFERKKSANFSGIDIVISTNEVDPHDKKSFVPVGTATDIYLKKDGVVAVNGHYFSEYGDKIKELSGKSAGLIEKGGKGWTADHVLICPTDKAVIKDLAPNATAMYAEGTPEKYEYVGSQKKSKKEQKMPDNEAMFSQSYVDLEIRKAEDVIKSELTANFAIEKGELETKIEQKNTVITELQGANETLKTQVAGFAKSDQERAVKKWHTEIDGFKGISVPEKDELKTKVAGFANKGMEAADIEVMIGGYRSKEPLVNEGSEPGDPKPANFASPYVRKKFGIEDIEAAIEAENGGE